MQWQELRSHIRHLPSLDIARIEKAFVLGKKMHDGQKRRSGEPYFNHPVAVAHMLVDLEADADTIIAALLHDTVEDTALTLYDIKREFGESVAMLIDGVTKLNSNDVAMSPKLDEQIETLRKIFTLMQQDVRIMVIKIVDRLHNMQTVEFLQPERQKILAKETIEVFVKIADKLCMQDMRDELESLCLAVLEPEIYPALLELRNLNEERGMKLMETMRQSLRTHDRIFGSTIGFAFEHKTWDQMNVQRSAGGSVATGLSFITVAFVCDDIDACYRTLGALHQLWRREVLSFQDFINAPQLNGYRGLHTTIIVQDGTRVRCKIRTKEMHEYARKGVAAVCFEGKTNIGDILPWTKHITPLTADTEGSSDNFWQSLRSDILGESIIIHGPGDTTVQVPRSATALDGAFYLLKDEALKTKQIKVNGKEVSLSTPLTNAASIDIMLDAHETCNREWLSFISTGLAAAAIRSALMKVSEGEKLLIGREILQKVFTERKRGFIEEFDEKKLQVLLNLLGYASLNDVYVAIADGRVEPNEVYKSLFETPRRKHESKSHPSVIRYVLDMDSTELMDRVNLVHRKYGSKLSDIRYHRNEDGIGRVSLQVGMSPQELNSFQKDLSTAGASNFSTHQKNLGTIALISSIVLLWGLDPVVAYKIIHAYNLTTLDLSIVRFWSLTGISGILFLTQRWKHSPSHVHLPLNNPSLWISVLLLICISFTTYHSLYSTLPLHYTIPMTTAGILLTSIVNRKKWQLLIVSWTLLIGGTVLLIVNTPSWTLQGIIFTFLAVLSFSLFSLVSERYKRSEHIAARAAQYFFVLSMLCTVMTLPLLPFTTVLTLSPSVLARMVFFAIFFAGLPYYIYYFLLTHKQIDFVLRYSFLIIFSTLAGQMLILDYSLDLATMMSALLVTIGAALPLLDIDKITRNAQFRRFLPRHFPSSQE